MTRSSAKRRAFLFVLLDKVMPFARDIEVLTVTSPIQTTFSFACGATCPRGSGVQVTEVLLFQQKKKKFCRTLLPRGKKFTDSTMDNLAVGQ
jgi:hypothetical protein